jgi:hypothetical protein
MLPPVEADAATLISALKESLPHALRAFYPLAGHVRLAPGRKDRHELLYQPGDGVPFTTAEYDADVDELASDDPVHVSSISPLVPATGAAPRTSSTPGQLSLLLVTTTLVLVWRLIRR